jgi:carboxyl-terminal processing protease
VRSRVVRLSGTASDESAVRDVYIFVGNDKVFFKPSQDTAGSSVLSFEAEVPLSNGLNYISVVAEETANLFTRETIAIRRDREDGMAYLQPHALNGEPELIGARPKESEF